MSTILEDAQKAFDIEIKCLQKTRIALDFEFQSVVFSILSLPFETNKVVTMGVGKSGFIARKIAATMSSTGTKAIFINPAEAVHGDIGIVSKGDIVIAISKSGKSQEILNIIPTLRGIGISRLVSIVADKESPLAKESSAVLLTPVEEELDKYNIVPTSSTTAALVMGDALAIAIMHGLNFTNQDFSKFHPGGSLGRGLSVKVSDLAIKDIRPFYQIAGIEGILEEMNRKPVGGVVVVDENKCVIGIITEADVRRAVLNVCNIKEIKAFEIMSKMPVTVNFTDTARYALDLMEKRDSQISLLPVVDDNNKFQGILRLHDVVKAGL
jgi:arabinose-5-phosphate isomerase